MDLKRLLGLRPKGETADDIAAALGRARAEEAAALVRAEDLTRRRADVLLGGSESEVTAAEAQLSEARADAERAGIVAAALAGKLAKVQLAAKVESVAAAVAKANELAAEAERVIRDVYPVLAERMVREVLLIEQQAIDARKVATDALRAAERDVQLGAEVGSLKLSPPPFQAIAQSLKTNSLPTMREHLGAEVRLPALHGEMAEWIWAGRPALGYVTLGPSANGPAEIARLVGTKR